MIIMGVGITEILVKDNVSLKELKRKVLAVDAYNQLYMFITTIRGMDGAVLSDSKGRTTSHLIGLFSRAANFISEGIKLVYCFDGVVPDLKHGEIQKRKDAKTAALKEYNDAKSREDIEGMKKFAGRTSRLTKEMVEEAKLLLEAMGIPYIMAPSEGEAQASYLVKKGDAYAVLSQDADCLLFGANKMIRNLSISGKRKVSGKTAFISIDPEVIELKKVLTELNITQDQLIVLSILVGTDYNPGGIKGIGPKKALKLVQEKSFEEIFAEVKWEEQFNIGWKTIFDTIKSIPITDDYEIKFRKINEEKVKELLLDFEFSTERIENTLKKINSEEQSQTGLGEYF